MPPKAVGVGWEGLFSPKYKSKRLTPLQSQASSDTARFVRTELNTTVGLYHNKVLWHKATTT